MFFTDSVAITVLWVFMMAAQMTKASGSNRRAASRTGCTCSSGLSSGITMYLASSLRSTRLTFCARCSAATWGYLKFS